MYYGGTEFDWENISIGSDNEALSNAKLHCAYYYVSLIKLGNGTVKLSKTIASVGDEIEVTAIPDDGYDLKYIKVNGKPLSEAKFPMPEQNVIVEVVFSTHNIVLVPAKDPTCNEDGHEEYYECSLCHKAFSDAEGKNEISKPVIPKLNHSWDDGEVTKEPTCEDAGSKLFHCTRDGCEETKTEQISALGHKLEGIPEVPPTKETPGVCHHYKCERCGKLFGDSEGKQEITQEDTVIPIKTHDLTKVSAKAATCTEAGNIEYYECKDEDCGCKKLYGDPYGQHEISIDDTVRPALGHDPEEVASKAPTCTEAGNEKYYKCSRCHKLFSDADAQNEINSDDTVKPALGHNPEEVAAKEATCTEDGYEKHYKCSRCDKLFSDAEGKNEISKPKAIKKLGHSWDEGEVTKEPTCEEEGVKTFHCTRNGCSGTKTETISALGHKLKTISEKAPSKTEPGHIKHYECERCGKLFSDANGKQELSQDAVVIPAMTHTLTFVNAKAATCTEDGNNAYYECQDEDCNCHKVYRDKYGQKEVSINDTVVPAIGHKISEVAAKEPTCTEDGHEKHYKCSRCNKLFSDAEGENEIEKPVAVTKLGHDMKHYEAKKPTHDEDGHIEYYHCNRCGKNFADDDGKTELTDAQIVDPKIGAAELGDEETVKGLIYRVTNPCTDGTGTVMVIGVNNPDANVSIPSTVEIKLETYKVTKVGTKAFYGNKTIKTVSIGANVTSIDSYAFYGCSNLTKVSGGAKLQIIGAKAFGNCPRLSSFTITSSTLKKIGTYAFYKDKKLKTINIKKTTKLTKSGVKNSLKSSSVKTVKVKKSKVKAYKKYFKKSNSGRKVKVKK